MDAELLAEKGDIKWYGIIGLEKAKKEFTQAVVIPRMIPDWFQGKRAPWCGILLYGPRGTGKSLLVTALVKELEGTTFVNIPGSELVKSFEAEGDVAVRSLFETARERAPAIIFIDNIDAALGEESCASAGVANRLKNEFHRQMDEISERNNGVMLLATTNAPYNLDLAVRRRFEKKIYIPLPDHNARSELINLKLQGEDVDLSDDELERIVDMSQGFSCAEVAALVRNGVMIPLNNCKKAEYFAMYREKLYPCDPCFAGAQKMRLCDMTPEQFKSLGVSPMCFGDLMDAARGIRPSTSADDVELFECLAERRVE